MCSCHGQRSKTSVATRNAPLKCFALAPVAELCHWLCVFVKEARRVDRTPYTPRSLLNYFLAYNASFFEHSNEKCPIAVLCTSDMAELCHWLCVFVKETRRDSNYFLTYSASFCCVCIYTTPESAYVYTTSGGIIIYIYHS